MKRMGVLGGLGPQATIDFEVRMHRVAQGLLPQQANTGYPPMVVWYHRHPPILLDDDGHPLTPFQPDPRLLEAARTLGRLVDFLVITSNGVHALYDELVEAAGCPILSLIEVTLAEVERRDWHKVGVLALMSPQIYAQPLVQRRIGWETIPAALQTELDAAVWAVMEGREGEASVATARKAVTSLRAGGVDGIILGCTEIPLLLREDLDAADLINPAELLAEAAVLHAIA